MSERRDTRTLPVVADVEVFRDDDDGYLRWTATHGDGFVLNCARTPAPRYLKIHRADCAHIIGHPDRGARWTKHYIKACSTSILALRDWANAATRGEATDCGICFRRQR
jgi:hypothetical protein